VISGGGLNALFKVDILNIMGLSMLAAAVLWGLGRSPFQRALALAAATVAVAMLTPPIRVTPFLDPLPGPIEWYVRPNPGRTTFTLLPWSGFLFSGAAIGVWLDSARTPRDERRVNVVLALVGPLIAIAAYSASFLPPIYEQTNFWTSSPTFFFLRLGILITALPVAYAWYGLWSGRSPLRDFGVASLFVYWIHVEMVYGVLTTAIHRRLTFEQALIAFALFAVLLFGLVKLKQWLLPGSSARKSGKSSAIWQPHQAAENPQ
jgi:uncharacterized membrane protein